MYYNTKLHRGTWAAFTEVYRRHDRGLLTCDGGVFQAGVYDPDTMVSIAFDGTRLNTSSVRELITRFPKLSELKLTANTQLTALPTELGGLAALMTLSVNNNRLFALPSELGGLRLLQFLAVNDNDITALPSELGKLLALTNLQIQGNRLVALPSELGALKQLVAVDLQRNMIQCKVRCMYMLF